MDNLYALSDTELVARLIELVQSERQATRGVTRHLAEINIRRLFCSLGYSSLYDYATRGLGYSGSAAMRRIKAARAGAQVPAVYDYLESGEMTLSTVEVFSDLLHEHQNPGLVDEFRGKSCEEAKQIAARYRPVPPALTRDRIEPVVVGARIDPRQGALAFEGGADRPDDAANLMKLAVSTDSVVTSPENRHHVSFTVGPEFMEQLRRAQELAFRGDKSDLLLEHVLGEALAFYVVKHCPKERAKRREERQTRAGVAAEETGKAHEVSVQNYPSELAEGSSPHLVNTANMPAIPLPRNDSVAVNLAGLGSISKSRIVPIGLKDQVLSRDNYQCTYVGWHGVRCGSRFNLEIDHILPFALGGKTSLDNLRVLCSAHNLAVEIECFGKDFVQECIQSTG